MCERVWRIAQDCAKKQGLSAGSRGCKPPEWCTRAKHAKSWSVTLAVTLQDKSQGWPGRLLAAWTRDSNSRLNPVVRSSRQNTLFGKNWLFTFLLTLLYIYPYTHDLERVFRENFERETLEKTRSTHPQSLPKRLFKFLYSLPLHCQILERFITKTFSHRIYFYEKAIWCFGKQLGRNQFNIGWYYGQVAESGKLEKK